MSSSNYGDTLPALVFDGDNDYDFWGNAKEPNPWLAVDLGAEELILEVSMAPRDLDSSCCLARGGDTEVRVGNVDPTVASAEAPGKAFK